MKKKILILMIGFLLIAVNLYAAGDLIVNGAVGIGTAAPRTALEIKSVVPAIFMEDTDDGAYWQFGVVGGAFQMVKTNSAGLLIHQPLLMDASGSYFNEAKTNLDVYFSGDTTAHMIAIDAGTESMDFKDNIPIKLGTGKDVVIDYDSGNNSLDIDLATNGVNTGLRILTDGSDTVVDGSTGNVGIGTTSPQEKLDVQGNVEAYGFITGDITFQKDGKKLWRMFEDEEGLYLESVKTGKVYRFVLQEIEKE